ncbi:MAG: recombination mediator RecR [Bacteroidales bacterium]|nr:recombination mediator RecR [Bacteroidales bacterium]
MDHYPSKLFEETVSELAKLPGIGKKTALRLTLFLLKQSVPDVESLGNAVINMRNNIRFCKQCHNISDSELCEICSNDQRDKNTICVVEDVRDVMAIENTTLYKGTYHVLGGIISPIEGIGPDDLTINSLVKKVSDNKVKEVIMALSTTIEGDTTNFYIYKKLKDHNTKLTTLARGVAIGDELEFADEVTLGRSILNRINYEDYLVK